MMERLSKKLQRLIKTVFKDEMVLEHLSGLGVEWKFSLEKGPPPPGGKCI
jgi:hypothetical protein